MMVQIYQNEELNDVLFQVESLDEWQQIAQELQMDKQLNFVNQATSPNPYPFITESMNRIFSTLCPTKVDFKAYDKTPIPLEVMKQIAFSVKEKHFVDIQIWYDDKTPDPFVVGTTQEYYVYDRSYSRLKNADNQEARFKSEYEAKEYGNLVGFEVYSVGKTNVINYLIARWGDEIRPIPELKNLAKERLLEKYGSELKNEIEEKNQALKKINENTLLFLNGEISESQVKGSRF
jgi:hypothetical protein